MPRPRAHLPARLLLGFGVALVMLGGVEATLRAVGVQAAYQRGAIGQWRLAPGLDRAESRGPRDGHSFVVSTNADGLRTRLPRARGPARRVALMGDSVPFGWGVDDGVTLADTVQAALGPEVEVLNAAQPGYSSVMAAWLFDEVVASYRPDLTVVFIPQHDANLVLVSDREYLVGGATPQASLRVWLARESRLYEVLRRLVDPDAARPWRLPDEGGAEPRVPRASDAEREAAFAGMRKTMEAWGGALAIGFLPSVSDFGFDGPGEPDRPGVGWARAWSVEAGVPLVDVRRCCPDRSGALVLPDDPGHYSVAGNERVGAAVADALRAEVGGP